MAINLLLFLFVVEKIIYEMCKKVKIVVDRIGMQSILKKESSLFIKF